jgi:hypothetical protein
MTINSINFHEAVYARALDPAVSERKIPKSRQKVALPIDGILVSRSLCLQAWQRSGVD